MRISDWSSDVCSSDLRFGRELGARRNEPDLALIEFVGGIAANAHPHSGRDTPQIRFADISPHINRSIKAEAIDRALADRSEERRVGKECVSTCSSRRSPDQLKKNY